MREDGRRGVVGREGMRVRDVDRWRAGRCVSFGVVDITASSRPGTELSVESAKVDLKTLETLLGSWTI